MSRQIAGFITEVDTWGRFRVTLPEVRNGTDTLNTYAQLHTFAEKNTTGWSPLAQKSYLAKPSKRCFAYDSAGKRVTDFSLLIQRNVVFEVDFVNYNDGWWIRVESIRAVD